jgi:two-component system, OmpR family, response regulator ChvI
MATVLLVDDDMDIVAGNKAVLEKRGHKVVCAYSAGEARDAAKKNALDAAVLDVMMESLDAGFNLARDLHKAFPKMPLLMLSGVEKATGMGFRFAEDETWLPVVKFLDKPVAPNQLADAVENAIGK